MAIQLPSGFIIGSREPIDSRLVLTKSEMLAMSETIMPDVYFAICKDDGKVYVYDKNSSTQSSETGFFKVYEAATDETTIALKLPAALEILMATDTGPTQLCNTIFNDEHFEVNKNKKIDLCIETIQAIGPETL